MAPSTDVHSCHECGGPTVAVTVDSTRFAPQRVRVDHLPKCKFFSELREQYPELIRQREEAKADRVLTPNDFKRSH